MCRSRQDCNALVSSVASSPAAAQSVLALATPGESTPACDEEFHT